MLLQTRRTFALCSPRWRTRYFSWISRSTTLCDAMWWSLPCLDDGTDETAASLRLTASPFAVRFLPFLSFVSFHWHRVRSCYDEIVMSRHICHWANHNFSVECVVMWLVVVIQTPPTEWLVCWSVIFQFALLTALHCALYRLTVLWSHAVLIFMYVCMYVSCVLCWLCLCWQRFYVTNPIHYLVRTRTVCVWSQALVTPAVVSEHTLVDFLYDRSSCFVLLSVVVVFSSVTWLIEKVECFFALIEKLAGKIIYEMAGIVSYRML